MNDQVMTKHSHTVSASTYEHIKKDIIFGTLEPGAKLKLGVLKECYDASVSTLRETLNRLASDGFVEAHEQRGFFVTPVSKEDILEIANLRVLLECHALQESIQNGDREWESELVAAHYKLHQMEILMRTGDRSQTETWKRYDSGFHLALIQACNSRNLLSLHSKIFDKYLRYQLLVLTFRGEVAEMEHKAMLDAALNRDAETAIKILKQHIQNGLEHCLDKM